MISSLYRTETNQNNFLTAFSQLSFVEILFLFSAFLAPLELRINASFTVHDLLILAIAGLILIGPGKLQMVPNRFYVAAYLFLFWALVSMFRATHPVEAVTEILQYAFIFLVQLPVILTVSRSPMFVRWSVICFLVGAFSVAFWAFTVQQAQGAGRIVTFISKNPNRLGYPTAYLFPLLLYFAFTQWSKGRRLLTLLIGVPVGYIFLWALAASASRSSTVAMLIAILTFIVFRKGLKFNFTMLARLFGAVLMIGAIGYLMYQANLFPATLRERIDRTLMFEESLVKDRERLAVAGMMAFEDSPFVGVGLDNFRYVAKTYVLAATNQVPHNLWIQLLSQVGIFGTLGFLAMILYWFLVVYTAEQKTDDQELREWIWALLATMSSVMMIYMFLPIMIQRQYWLLYGLGLAIALPIHNRAQKAVNSEE